MRCWFVSDLLLENNWETISIKFIFLYDSNCHLPSPMQDMRMVKQLNLAAAWSKGPSE